MYGNIAIRLVHHQGSFTIVMTFVKMGDHLPKMKIEKEENNINDN